MNIALRNARERGKLTQAEVAAKAKVSYRAYQSYETESREPKVSAAIRIADVLGITGVRELFAPASDEPHNLTTK